MGSDFSLSYCFLIMRIVELPWIGTFAGCLHFDKTDKSIRYGDREVRTCLHFGECRLANEVNATNWQSRYLCKFLHKRFERGPRN